MLSFNTWQNGWTIVVVILGGGLVVGKLTERPKVPDVAAFLALGIVIGPGILRWVAEPVQSQVNQWLLYFGAVLILFEGGRSLSLRILKQIWITVGALATLGVLVSTLTVGLFARVAFGLPWPIALLLGAVIASTDPATLIPVFKRVPVIPRLQQAMEAESAFNDATAAVLMAALVQWAVHPDGFAVWQSIWQFISQAGIGVIVGAGCGVLAVFLISPKAWGAFHEYGSLVLLLAALVAFELSYVLQGSGLMAAFVAGIVAGNADSLRWDLHHHTNANADHFFHAMTLIARMLIFVLLGTQVSFPVVGKYLAPGLVVVMGLILIARPLTVASGALLDRSAKWSLRELALMSWVRETGVIPAALSGMLVARHVPGANVISAVTFLAILLTILVQATSMPFVARRLGVLAPSVDEEI